MKDFGIYILLISFPLISQNAILESDTNYCRIGEHFNLNITVNGVGQDSLVWPSADSLFKQFELLDHSLINRSLNNDTSISSNYRLTSFDTGKFIIPSVAILHPPNDTLFTNPLQINFLATPLDTTNQFFDIKPPKKIIFLTRELLRYILYVLLFIFCVILIFLLVRYFKKRERSEVLKLKPDIPIDIYFLNQLDELEKKQYLKEERYKDFYTDLSEIFRGYLEMRFHIPALESSTYELKELLVNLKIQDSWLNSFFRNNDIVKFAKGIPSKKDSLLFLEHIKTFIRNFGVSNLERDDNHLDQESTL